MICESFYKSIGLSTPKHLEKNDRVKFNRFVFQNYFLPRMESCKLKNTFIELSSKDLKFIEDFTDRKVKAKTKEWKGVDSKYRT